MVTFDDCEIDGRVNGAIDALGDEAHATVAMINGRMRANRYDTDGTTILGTGDHIVQDSLHFNADRDRVDLSVSGSLFDATVEELGGHTFLIGTTVLDQFSQTSVGFEQGPGLGSPTFVGDYDTGDTTQWTFNQFITASYPSTQYSVDPTLPRFKALTDGVYGSVRRHYLGEFWIYHDDNPLGDGHKRSEVSLGGTADGIAKSRGDVAGKQVASYDWWTYVPSATWLSTTTPNILSQWHAQGASGGVAGTFKIRAQGVSPRFNFKFEGGDPNAPTQVLTTAEGDISFPTIGLAIPYDSWHHFRVDLRWGSDGTGYLQVWVDGVKLIDKSSVALGYTGASQQVYFKQGFYVNTANPPLGQPAIIRHSRTYIGPTPESVQTPYRPAAPTLLTFEDYPTLVATGRARPSPQVGRPRVDLVLAVRGGRARPPAPHPTMVPGGVTLGFSGRGRARPAPQVGHATIGVGPVNVSLAGKGRARPNPALRHATITPGPVNIQIRSGRHKPPAPHPLIVPQGVISGFGRRRPVPQVGHPLVLPGAVNLSLAGKGRRRPSPQVGHVVLGYGIDAQGRGRRAPARPHPSVIAGPVNVSLFGKGRRPPNVTRVSTITVGLERVVTIHRGRARPDPQVGHLTLLYGYGPSDAFGTIITAETVERAMVAQLKLWIPPMLQDVYREAFDNPFTAQFPRSYQAFDSVERWAQQAMPAIIVTASKTDANPQIFAEHYDASYACEVSVILSASTHDDARKIAQRYTGAIRAAVVQQGGDLGGLASSVKWIRDDWSVLSAEPRNRIASATVSFMVIVDRVQQRYADTHTVPPPGYPPPDLPKATEIEVTVQGEP